MADPGSSIFNEKASEKLRSPDDLDKYVRVTNPGVWVVLAACASLIIGLLAWGVFGAVTTIVTDTGVRIDNRVVCYFNAEDTAHIAVGDTAMVGGERFKVSSISEVPYSREEAYDLLESDYLVSTLFEGDYAYEVEFEGPIEKLDEDIPLAITVNTERVAPISLILG